MCMCSIPAIYSKVSHHFLQNYFFHSSITSANSSNFLRLIHQPSISGKESSRRSRKLNGTCSDLSQRRVRDPPHQVCFLRISTNRSKRSQREAEQKAKHILGLGILNREVNECLKVINFTQGTSTHISKERSSLNLKVEQS